MRAQQPLLLLSGRQGVTHNGSGLRYEPDAGYVVIELDSGEELWVQADGGGFHIFTSAVDESCLPVGIA